MSQEQNVYKELYEANELNKQFRATLETVVFRLCEATGKSIEESNLEELLVAVEAKFKGEEDCKECEI